MYKDTRLGGVGKWYHSPPEDANMRIPDGILNCVVFLCVKIPAGDNAGKYQPIGTGFFVGVTQGGVDFLYLITAEHILAEAKRGGFRTIYARMNKINGAADYVELLPVDKWGRMLDSDAIKGTAVDLAFLPFAPDLTVFDVSAVPLESLLSDVTSVKQSIGIGDDLFVVGLFSLHYGKQRNISIVRTGAISAMLQEPILDKQNRPYMAYLAEMRSIGGLSGSPVFVALNKHRPCKTEITNENGWQIYLLGLIRGHWDLKRDLSEDSGHSTQDIFLGYSKGENMNVGIAVVTPAQYLLAILTHPVSVEHRNSQIMKMEQNNQITEDSLLTERNSLEPAPIFFSDERFQNALKRASRKISEPVEETKET